MGDCNSFDYWQSEEIDAFDAYLAVSPKFCSFPLARIHFFLT